jgi:hypothetical protein
MYCRSFIPSTVYSFHLRTWHGLFFLHRKSLLFTRACTLQPQPVRLVYCFRLAESLPLLAHLRLLVPNSPSHLHPYPGNRHTCGALTETIGQTPEPTVIIITVTLYQYSILNPRKFINHPAARRTLRPRLCSPYITSSFPTLPPSGSVTPLVLCSHPARPPDGALFHSQSRPTSRSSRPQSSTPSRSIGHNYMDPMGAIRVWVCSISTRHFTPLEALVLSVVLDG